MKLNNNLYFYPEKGVLDCNTYIMKDKLTVLIDVGLDKNLPSLIRDFKNDGIDPDEIDIIGNTHLHLDHSWANQEFKEKYSAKIKIAPVQKKFYDVGVRETAKFFNIEPVEFQEDGLLDSEINIGDIEIQLIETPGHSPDSICFYIASTRALICGDLIFQNNIGRPDLPGGNIEHLEQSIEKIAQMDIDMLLPGHMNIITSSQKVKQNFEFVKNSIL
jgi:hydroxyacylglutathione hydrolase